MVLLEHKCNTHCIILCFFFLLTVLPHPPTNQNVPIVQPSPSAASEVPQASTPTAVTSNSSAPVVSAAPVSPLPPPHVLTNSSYSEWSAWSKCSATCGPKVVMSRKRTCKLKTGCQGLNLQTKPCPFVECPGNIIGVKIQLRPMRAFSPVDCFLYMYFSYVCLLITTGTI